MWEVLLMFLGNSYWLFFALAVVLYLSGLVLIAKDEQKGTKKRPRR